MCLGIPGRIVAVDDEARLAAVVEVGGVRRVANVACVLDPNGTVTDTIGQWVLLHAGFAMSRIDAAEAERTLELLAALGEEALAWAEDDPGAGTP